MVDKARCRRCRYFKWEGALGAHCEYILATGKSRLLGLTPEQIKKGECLVFEENAAGARRRKPTVTLRAPETIGIRRLSNAEICDLIESRARVQYDKGLTDTAIAARLGCATSSILRWRRRNHLPSNYLRGGHKGKTKRSGY